MFKKPQDVEVSRNHILGGKDVKKLKQCVLGKVDGLTDEHFAALFPQKHVVQRKLTSGCVVYVNIDENPMLVDVNGHADVIAPTIYACSACDQLLPNLQVNAAAVSATMMRGSDLFLQGIDRSSIGEPFLQGQVRSVSVPGNPVPFAVGKMATSQTKAEQGGFQGRGVISIHYYGDFLWQSGDQVPPNPGFRTSCVVALDEESLAEAFDEASLGTPVSPSLAYPSTMSYSMFV